MKHLFYILLLLAGLSAHAQPAAWTLALPIENPNGIMSVATGPDGNVYVTGRFVGTLQFGGTRIKSSRAGTCLYIAKCTPSGRVLRVTKLEGATDVLPRSIAVDKAGNSYVTGSFQGTLTYNRGQQTTALNTELGGTNVYLVKCSPSGAVSWVRQGQGGANAIYRACEGVSVAVDLAGNSYVTGTVSGPNVQFGNLTFGLREFQGFLASYDRQGELRWARVFAALPGGFDSSGGGGVVVDNAGYCYVGGSSTRGWTLDGITLLSPNDTGYLARFETKRGRLLWAQSIPANSNGAIAIDKVGDVCIGGSFSGTVAFGPNISLTSTGNTDGFVARYDPNGDIDWATALGGPNDDYVEAIAIGPKSRKVVATGLMNFTSQGTNQSYLSCLNENGQVQKTELVGGPGTSTGGGLAIDTKNNIYLVGVFTGSCRFGRLVLTSVFTQDFLARYGSRLSSDGEHRNDMAVSAFPNPAQNQFTLRLTDLEQPMRATLYNQQGRAVAEHTLQPGAVAVDTVFDTAALPDGLYTLRLQSGEEVRTRLLMVQH